MREVVNIPVERFERGQAIEPDMANFSGWPKK